MFKVLRLFIMIGILCSATSYAELSPLQDAAMRIKCRHRHHCPPIPECRCTAADRGPPGPPGASTRAYANLFLNSSTLISIPPIVTSGTTIPLPGISALKNLEYDPITGEVIILYQGDYLIEVAASLANAPDFSPNSQTLGIVKGNLAEGATNFTIMGSYAVVVNETAVPLSGRLILTLYPGDRIAFANVDISDPPLPAYLYSSPTGPAGGGAVATLNILLLNGAGT